MSYPHQPRGKIIKVMAFFLSASVSILICLMIYHHATKDNKPANPGYVGEFKLPQEYDRERKEKLKEIEYDRKYNPDAEYEIEEEAQEYEENIFEEEPDFSYELDDTNLH